MDVHVHISDEFFKNATKKIAQGMLQNLDAFLYLLEQLGISLLQLQVSQWYLNIGINPIRFLGSCFISKRRGLCILVYLSQRDVRPETAENGAKELGMSEVKDA